MKKLLIVTTLFVLGFNTKSQCQKSVLSLGLSTKNSVLAEFTKPYSRNQNFIYGGGVSFCYNKGNKGKDYTGFINDFTQTYETILAPSGPIYMHAGKKFNNTLAGLVKLGLGVKTEYINGKGIGYLNLPDELWYVRKAGSNNFLYGLILQFSGETASIRLGWDSFNSFNLGAGINILDK